MESGYKLWECLNMGRSILEAYAVSMQVKRELSVGSFSCCYYSLFSR